MSRYAGPTRVKFEDLGETEDGKLRRRYVGLMTESEYVAAIMRYNGMESLTLDEEVDEEHTLDLFEELEALTTRDEAEGWG